MTKKTISITLDEENADWARQNLNNISSTINEFLENCIARYDGDIEGIDYKLEKMKEKKLQAKLLKLQSEIQVTQERIQLWEEKKAEKEQKRLENEKKTIEKAETCQNCGTKITPKWHKFAVGQICNTCLLGANAEDVRKWREK